MQFRFGKNKQGLSRQYTCLHGILQEYLNEALRGKLPTELLFTDSKVGLDFESSSVILPDLFHSSETN